MLREHRSDRFDRRSRPPDPGLAEVIARRMTDRLPRGPRHLRRGCRVGHDLHGTVGQVHEQQHSLLCSVSHTAAWKNIINARSRSARIAPQVGPGQRGLDREPDLTLVALPRRGESPARIRCSAAAGKTRRNVWGVLTRCLIAAAEKSSDHRYQFRTAATGRSPPPPPLLKPPPPPTPRPSRRPGAGSRYPPGRRARGHSARHSQHERNTTRRLPTSAPSATDARANDATAPRRRRRSAHRPHPAYGAGPHPPRRRTPAGAATVQVRRRLLRPLGCRETPRRSLLDPGQQIVQRSVSIRPRSPGPEMRPPSFWLDTRLATASGIAPSSERATSMRAFLSSSRPPAAGRPPTPRRRSSRRTARLGEVLDRFHARARTDHERTCAPLSDSKRASLASSAARRRR